MISPYAQLRLLWRPMSLWSVLLVVWIGGFPFLLATGDIFEPVAALWRGEAGGDVVVALWRALAFVPGVVGLLIAQARLEVLQTPLAWHVPALRAGLRSGAVLVGVMCSTALALLVLRSVGPLPALGAFGVACYVFVAAGNAIDPAVPLTLRLGVLLPVAAIVARPDAAGRLLSTASVAVAPLALALAWLLLRPVVTAAHARARAAHRAEGARAPVAGWYRPGEWQHDLATTRALPWLRAAAHESGLRFPLAHVAHAALAVLIVRLVNNPGFFTVFAGGFLMTSGMQLGTRLHYPLPRARRAWLAWLGTLIDAAVYCAAAAALALLPVQLAIPDLPFGATDVALTDWVLSFGCAFALAPIAQWGRLRWPPEIASSKSGPMQLAHLLRLLVYLFSVGSAVVVIEKSTRVQGDPARMAIALVLLLITVQAVHAALIHRHFTARDLLPTRR